MNIYIKSFNRPFYLDRCIRSIRFNVCGYKKLIVLDDGTFSLHLKRLQEMYPDVEFRSSGADDGKIELLRQEKFDDIAGNYPVATEFWVGEIEKDEHPYTLVLEDDAWIVQRVDLGLLNTELLRSDAVICKMWWSNHMHKVLAGSTSPGSVDIEYFEANCGSLSQAASIWIVAFAVFRTDYWLRCVSSAKRLGDERSQLLSASAFANSHSDVQFCKTSSRAIHQGWMIPARSTAEYYEKGLVQHLYMDALNEAWYLEKLDVTSGYPFDFPISTIRNLLLDRLDKATVDVWQDWHTREVRYFYG